MKFVFYAISSINVILKILLVYILWFTKDMVLDYLSLSSVKKTYLRTGKWYGWDLHLDYGGQVKAKGNKRGNQDDFYKKYYDRIEEEPLHNNSFFGEDDFSFKDISKQEEESYRSKLYGAGFSFIDIKHSLEILGLKYFPTEEDELKKAYREKSKIHHPDTGGSEEKFQELVEAYELIKDGLKKMK